LRDGEEVDTAYYDTTDIAIYFIEKNFDVELSQVTVPAARKNYTYSDGVYTCLRDNSLVDDAGQCPKADTTFSDCFKVTQITIMTMMGSGVEYGQKVYTWLAKDHGVVKSDMYIRWSDNPYFESSIVGEIDEFGRIWTGYSKIELSKLDIEKSGNVFREMFQSADIVKLKDLEYISDFNYDPFKISNQTGFHTIEEDF